MKWITLSHLFLEQCRLRAYAKAHPADEGLFDGNESNGSEGAEGESPMLSPGVTLVRVRQGSSKLYDKILVKILSLASK